MSKHLARGEKRLRWIPKVDGPGVAFAWHITDNKTLAFDMVQTARRLESPNIQMVSITSLPDVRGQP